MKFVFLIFLLSAGCATGVIKDHWVNSLIGKTGVITEPVQIVKDEKKNWASFAEFKRCAPVEVVEVRAYGKNTGLVVKQEGKLFYIWSAQNFINAYKLNPSEAKLEQYIAPTKQEALGEKKIVKLVTGTTDSHQLQCQSTYWAGMTAKQLIFVKGQPDRVSKTGSNEHWFYNEKKQQEVFELADGKLTHWQI